MRLNKLFGSDWLNVTVGQFELPLTFSPEMWRAREFRRAGHVGATTAYALLLSGLGAQIVLIDQDAALAPSPANDMRSHSLRVISAPI